ncbi:plasmid mobilization protein [Treponema sp.]|uniref:plasmid mobilization protein n=1 Tax=Treponema sp. TaxID=166 RepID=UPI00298E031E|nr:plasmid mobilization relaxosome protein MobC [Treponema sp.]MCR5613238.1 MobC family plasmid mobilization relaxosome protein [Treponema sp.]
MNKSRPHKITFRVSDSELQELKLRVEKSEFSMQQFLIRAVFSKAQIEKGMLEEILFELRKQGVNLNQIARACNLGHMEAERERILITLKKLESLWRYLKS